MLLGKYYNNDTYYSDLIPVEWGQMYIADTMHIYTYTLLLLSWLYCKIAITDDDHYLYDEIICCKISLFFEIRQTHLSEILTCNVCTIPVL